VPFNLKKKEARGLLERGEGDRPIFCEKKCLPAPLISQEASLSLPLGKKATRKKKSLLPGGRKN